MTPREIAEKFERECISRLAEVVGESKTRNSRLIKTSINNCSCRDIGIVVRKANSVLLRLSNILSKVESALQVTGKYGGNTKPHEYIRVKSIKNIKSQ